MPFRIERRTTGKASLATVDPSQRRESPQREEQEPQRAGVADLIESPGAFAISRRANRDRRPSNDDLQWPLPDDESGDAGETDEEEPPMDADVSSPSQRSHQSHHTRQSRQSRRSHHDEEESLQDSSSDASERSDEAQIGPNPGYVVLGTSKSPRQKWLLIGFVAALVVFGGIVVGLVVALMSRGDSSAEGTGDPEPKPHLYLSCADLEPLTLSSDILNFEPLKDELGLETSPSITVCTPAIEALIFVAQDFDTLSPEARLNRFVLSILWVSLGGIKWDKSEFSNWMTSISECEWEGVTCRDGLVSNIEITQNEEAEGQLPSEIAMLGSLERLEIINCQLRGTVPPAFETLTNLAHLDLGFNHHMEGEPLPTLVQMTRLQYLGLRNNRFTGSIPEDFGSLKSLTYLNFFQNNFSGEIPNTIGEVTALKFLSIGNYEQSGTIPQSFYELTNLENLRISVTSIHGTLATELGKLTKLTNLVMSDNDIYGQIPSEIGLLTELNYLELEDEKLDGTIPTTFNNLTSLKTLKMVETSLTGSIPTGLCAVVPQVPCEVECSECPDDSFGCDKVHGCRLK